MVLGVSATTSATNGFNPGVAVFGRSTHALLASSANGTIPAQWCPFRSPCVTSWHGGFFSSGRGGSTVRMTMRYSPSRGVATFHAADEYGQYFDATYNAGMGQSFNQARIGTEFGSSPWDASYSYKPPATSVKVASYTDVSLTSYSGHTATLSSRWVRHKLLARQPGSGWVADPHDLYNAGASFQTWFVP